MTDPCSWLPSYAKNARGAQDHSSRGSGVTGRTWTLAFDLTYWGNLHSFTQLGLAEYLLFCRSITTEMTKYLPTAENFGIKFFLYSLSFFLPSNHRKFSLISCAYFSESKPWNPVHPRLLWRSTRDLWLASPPVTGSFPRRYCLHQGVSRPLWCPQTSLLPLPHRPFCLLLYSGICKLTMRTKPFRTRLSSHLFPAESSEPFPMAPLPFHRQHSTLPPSFSANLTISDRLSLEHLLPSCHPHMPGSRENLPLYNHILGRWLDWP